MAPDRRVLGVIRPTAEIIGQFTKSNQVGVLGTVGVPVLLFVLIGRVLGGVVRRRPRALPPAIGEALSEEDMTKTSLIALIERTVGMPIKFMEQVIDAALAPRQVAELLQVRPRTPLLLFERTYFAARGEPVEHAISYQSGRRYPYRMVLSRSERGR